METISFIESCRASGGSGAEWDYIAAEYIGIGVGYGLKKLWKAFQFLSANIYAMRSNPKLLYQ